MSAIKRAAINQIRNVLKIASGRPLATPSLGSMTLDPDDLAIARKQLKDTSGWYDREAVTRYEVAFARWNGSAHAFAFMGGRVALSACIYALDLRPGDEVIMPGYTCVVVPNAFHFAGIEIVYSDIEPNTYGLDASLIEKKITHRTRAVLLHHLYGLVCRDYEAVLDIANRYGLKVIEDCAQATGAEYRNVKVGNRGHVAIYSSEQSKVLNTVQGGLAVTNDEALSLRLRDFYEQAPFPDEKRIARQLYTLLLNYYQFKHPHGWWMGDIVALAHGSKRLISTTAEEEKGVKPAHYGCKMPAVIAAIGLNQLEKIDRYNKKRRETARRWSRWCHAKGYNRPLVLEESVPVFLRYPVMVEPEKKRDTSWSLRELGVHAGVWFASHIHPTDQPVRGCPVADRAVARCINLPGILQ